MIPFTIGRENEQHKLAAALKSNKAELIALYGRRRVGKTHLIKHVIDQYSDAAINFEITGKKDGSLKDQIKIFVRAIEKALKSAFPIQPPDNWFDAFDMLTKIFAKLPKNKLIILFFDELPWLATQKSGLLEALDHFWNTEWNYLSKLKLIVCGSAASWILDNLINAKGGLHNRLTSIIPLRPFKIKEARDFLKKNKIKLNDKQILDLYMVMGGIPFYLDGVEKGYSAIQNINNLCFTADGLLFKEFDRLYASLFDKSEAHIEIIKAIAKYHYGIEQNALLAKLKFLALGEHSQKD